MATKTDPQKIRQVSLRVTAKRRGLNLMKRGEKLWITRDGELVAGGPRGLTLDEAERLIRHEGFGREMAMAG